MSKKKDFMSSKFLQNGSGINIEQIMTPKDDSYIDFVREVPYDLIYPNPKNRKISVDEKLMELADSIKIFGLMDILRVVDDGNGKFMLTAGERRWTAIGLIREKDPNFMKSGVPCYVAPKDTDALSEETRLLSSNILREDYTPEELRTVVSRLKEIYDIKLEKGEYIPESLLKGCNPNRIKAKEIVANSMDLSVRQVEKIIAINEYLIPEITSIFDKGELPINAANVISHLAKEHQIKLYQHYLETGKIGEADIKAAQQAQREEDEVNKQLKEKNRELTEIINNMKVGTLDTSAAQQAYAQKEAEINTLTQKKRAAKSYSISQDSKEVRLMLAINKMEDSQNTINRLTSVIELDESQRLRLRHIIKQLTDLLGEA